MRRIVGFSLGLLLCPGLVHAAMVRNDTIGQDPAKEKLCAARAKSTNPNGKLVPFDIDSDYVARAREQHPDVTFIVFDGGALIDCYLREGTGKFEPAGFTGEGEYIWRAIRPKQFEPSVQLNQGRAVAADICQKAALAKLTKEPDHSVNNNVFEVDMDRDGILVSGKTAHRYDVAVEGTSFYKTDGPDMSSVKFTCLLSPMLEVKAVKLNSKLDLRMRRSRRAGR